MHYFAFAMLMQYATMIGKGSRLPFFSVYSFHSVHFILHHFIVVVIINIIIVFITYYLSCCSRDIYLHFTLKMDFFLFLVARCIGFTFLHSFGSLILLCWFLYSMINKNSHLFQNKNLNDIWMKAIEIKIPNRYY